MPPDTDDPATMPTAPAGEPVTDADSPDAVASPVEAPDAVTGHTGAGVSSSVIEPGTAGAQAGQDAGGGAASAKVDDNAIQTLDKVDAKPHVITRPGRNGGTLTPYDSERARAAAARRTELHRRRVAERVLGEAAAAFPDVRDVYDAHAALVAIQYQIAANPGGTASEARAATEAYKVVRQALHIGDGAPAQRGGSTVAADGISIQIGGQAAAELVAILGARVGNGKT